MNNGGYHAPYFNMHIPGYTDRFIILVLRHKQESARGFPDTFHCQFSIKHRNNNIIVNRIDCAVDNQNVTVMYSRAYHRIARRTQKKCRGTVPDQIVIQIKFAIQIIIRG